MRPGSFWGLSGVLIQEEHGVTVFVECNEMLQTNKQSIQLAET